MPPSFKLGRPKGDGDPKLCFRAASRFPFAIAFWNRVLAEGEKGDASCNFPPDWLPFPDNGELPGVFGLAFRDPDDRRYLGGVIYFVPGVIGGVLLGSRPRRARWEGVKGISTKLSFGRYKGYCAAAIFMRKSKRKTRIITSGYVDRWMRDPNHKKLKS